MTQLQGLLFVLGGAVIFLVGWMIGLHQGYNNGMRDAEKYIG